jgi:hypothetical protein
VLTREPVLTGYPVLTRGHLLAGHWLVARLKRLAVVRMLAANANADADALADPDGAGAKHASQLAGTRHVRSFARAQREVLVVVAQVARSVTDAARDVIRRCLSWSWAGANAGRLAVGGREPVVRVRPGRRLLRIIARRTDALGELG